MPTLAVEAEDCPRLVSQSRPAHWVIRTTDLKASLKFLSEVFGMRVLRHEEYDQPCAITCNGAYRTPWSKTMIGFGPENECYCLELTYNYGISSYQKGAGLSDMGVGVEDPEAALRAAASLGYKVAGDMVTAFDGYEFRVIRQPPKRKERFQYVGLRVKELQQAVAFYQGALGMEDLTATSEHIGPGATSGALDSGAWAVVGYAPEGVPLLLREDARAGKTKREQWEGRNAIAVPASALREMYRRVGEAEQGSFNELQQVSIVHPIREFNELPALRRLRGLPPMSCEPPPPDAEGDKEFSTLAVAVIRDQDGYEVCLVSAETYDAAVSRAYNPDALIDWAWRADALAGKRTPTPIQMLACV